MRAIFHTLLVFVLCLLASALGGCGGSPFALQESGLGDSGTPPSAWYDAGGGKICVPSPVDGGLALCYTPTSDDAGDHDGSVGLVFPEDGGPDAEALDAAIDAGPPDTGVDACVLATHSDGVGQGWSDCVPVGTLDEDESSAACAAYAKGVGGSAANCAARDLPAVAIGATCAPVLPTGNTTYVPVTCYAPAGACVGHCWGYGSTGGGVYSCACMGEGSWQ
jgi:hypothetical protein